MKTDMQIITDWKNIGNSEDDTLDSNHSGLNKLTSHF